MAGGVDGGIDYLDGGGEGGAGIDVAVHVNLHALFHQGEVGLGDVDNGFQTVDLRKGEDGSTGVHLSVLVVFGADYARELGTDKGVLVLETLGLHQLVIAGLGLVVDLFAYTARCFQCRHAVELGLGAGKVDACGVELGLVHAHEHGSLLHAAAHLHIDVFDVAGDAGRYVHGFVAFESGRELENLGNALALQGLYFYILYLLFGSGGFFLVAFPATGCHCAHGYQQDDGFKDFLHIVSHFYFYIPNRFSSATWAFTTLMTAWI